MWGAMPGWNPDLASGGRESAIWASLRFTDNDQEQVRQSGRPGPTREQPTEPPDRQVTLGLDPPPSQQGPRSRSWRGPQRWSLAHPSHSTRMVDPCERRGGLCGPRRGRGGRARGLAILLTPFYNTRTLSRSRSSVVYPAPPSPITARRSRAPTVSLCRTRRCGLLRATPSASGTSGRCLGRSRPCLRTGDRPRWTPTSKRSTI